MDPAAPPPEPALSTGAVARRLGVSPTTLRSWERRYAIGPARREDGRHRRWTPGDIARLEEMCRLTARGVPPSEAARAALGAAPAARAGGRAAAVTPGGPGALPLGEVRPEARGLARAAVRLDAPVVAELLEAALADCGVVTAWEEVIAPTLHAVGRKWASAGERYVEVEHLLSWQVSAALHRVRPAPERPDTPPVLLACVPGELHSLPIEALAAALAERGVPVRMFGAALPAEALCDAAPLPAPPFHRSRLDRRRGSGGWSPGAAPHAAGVRAEPGERWKGGEGPEPAQRDPPRVRERAGPGTPEGEPGPARKTADRGGRAA
ncbi:MerR family transcriptional regulator [Streptomyces sp. NPDC048551]|uniref:MerR family transcriptional regulator n=1 Tax=Streptomyces sp. NPDC048551 TaxID=3155758 RepID=UPI003430EAEF